GVSGLRPTYGRVSRHGAMALSWTLDKLGPMCRSADDCGLVLAAIAGPDPLDPSSAAAPFAYPAADVAGPRGRKWKSGVIKGATANVQPEVKKNFEDSLQVLGQFADVAVEVELPSLPFGEVVTTVVKAEGASAFRDLLDSGKAQQLRAASDRWGGYAAAMV